MLQFAQDVAVDGVQASHTFIYNGNAPCETLLRDLNGPPCRGARKSPPGPDFDRFLVLRFAFLA
jgi:hypothetical protein